MIKKSEIDLEIRGHYGRTALHLAANNDHLKIVEWLVLVGANIHAQDKYGDTALMNSNGNSTKWLLSLADSGMLKKQRETEDNY